MSILDRYVVKDEEQTGFSKNFKCNGEAGIWNEEFKNIPTVAFGIDEVFFHQDNDEQCLKIIREYGFNDIPLDGYVIIVKKDKIDVYSSTNIGFIYASKRIVSSINKDTIECGKIFNYPTQKFRAIKTYLPAQQNLEEFFKLVEYCLYYGLNTIMIEVGGAMEYKTHPEINEGWVEYCNKFKEYPGKSVEYQFSTDIPKNSIHWENAGGGYLSQITVKKIVDYCKIRGINVIPELPVFSHCDYLLYNHRELAERLDDETPDTYCPSQKGSYDLVIDLLNEIINVFDPKIINIGHDEVYSICQCEKCKNKRPDQLFADDVNFYNRYLKEKGISTMIWGDKLFNAIGKKGHTWGGSRDIRKDLKGRVQSIIPEMYNCINLIDKDVIIMHWYWFVDRKLETQLENKFCTIYGNFKGVELYDAKRRMNSFIDGFCISNWAECKQILLQRNGIYFHVAFSSMMVWSGNFNSEDIKENIIKVANDIFETIHHNDLKQSYIEIIHNTDEFKAHNEFVDGFFPVMEDEYLGKYIITSDLGEKIEIPVYNNFNIGYSKNSFESQEHEIYDCRAYDAQLFETTYTCTYVPLENQMYYKTIVPVHIKGNNIKWEFYSKNNKKINTKSIKLVKN